MAKCSGDTALRDIQKLLESGILLRNPAKGRSANCRLAESATTADAGEGTMPIR